MAKGMREIKRKIKSVQNTKQITKAMEMVAAAKLRRAQEAAQNARPYADKLKEVVVNIAAGTKGVKHPMLLSRPIKKTGYLVVTSDRGLAGGYNANVLRNLLKTINERHQSKDDYVLFVVGRKGRDYLRRRNLPIVEEVTGLSDNPSFADIKVVASKAVAQFADGTFDELYIHYNQFINALTQNAIEKRLLPLENVESSATGASYEYEPSAEEVL